YVQAPGEPPPPPAADDGDAFAPAELALGGAAAAGFRRNACDVPCSARRRLAGFVLLVFWRCHERNENPSMNLRCTFAPRWRQRKTSGADQLCRFHVICVIRPPDRAPATARAADALRSPEGRATTRRGRPLPR